MTLDEARFQLRGFLALRPDRPVAVSPEQQEAISEVLRSLRSFEDGCAALLRREAKANERMQLARRHLRQVRMVNTLDGARDYAALAYRALDGRRR